MLSIKRDMPGTTKVQYKNATQRNFINRIDQDISMPIKCYALDNRVARKKSF